MHHARKNPLEDDVKLLTLTPGGTLIEGIRLADLSEADHLPNLNQGILILHEGRRAMIRLDRRQPPEIRTDPRGVRRVHEAAIGTYYPEQTCAPNATPAVADTLFHGTGPFHDTVLIAAAPTGDQPEDVPKAAVRRTPERRDEEWHPFYARGNRILRMPEAELVPDRDPAHLLFTVFAETVRISWGAHRDWVIQTDAKGQHQCVSFADYERARREWNRRVDEEMTGSLM